MNGSNQRFSKLIGNIFKKLHQPIKLIFHILLTFNILEIENENYIVSEIIIIKKVINIEYILKISEEIKPTIGNIQDFLP